MVRKLIALSAVLALGISACGSASNKGALKQAANNPQIQQHEKEAQKIIQGCLSRGNIVTHAGRKAILRCIAPPGHEAAFQSCAAQDLGHSGVLTKGQRQRFYQGLAVCLEKNR